MMAAILKRLTRPQLFGPAMLADPYLRTDNAS